MGDVMRRHSGLIAAGWLVAAALAIAAHAEESTAKFGRYRPAPVYPGMVSTSLYIPMRDGVRLAVSVSRPANADGKPAEGRFPVIWHHTLALSGRMSPNPPNPDAPARGYSELTNLPRHGYVVVQVARRANGPSFGRRRGYNDRTEAYDAYQVIDWLASQAWSTGNIGIYGCSNTGDAAMHAVTSANPHLKAAWAGCYSWEKYDGFLRGGIFANWGTGPERSIEQDMMNTPVQGDEAKVLLRQAAEEHQGAFPLAKMWEKMPYRDSWSDATQSRFWYEGSVATYLPQINRSGTAIYIQGGWADDLRAQGVATYLNLTGERRLIIGPWGHCQNGDFDLVAEIHRFFDQHLKGMDTRLNAEDPIHYYTINAPAGTEWRASKTWPVAGATSTTLFLTGAANGLATAAPRKASPVSFTVRYDVDCPSARPGPGGLLTGAPPCPLEHGGPRFVTPPLKADTEVTGDAIADLWLTASTADANLFVYLEDVAPDGTVTQVTDARLKASLRKLDAPPYANNGLPWHRGHAEDAAPLTPGEPARLQIAFLPNSFVFRAGHRIRISVAGADYRERDRTPKSPAPQLTLLNDAGHLSAIVLPIVGKAGL
jgi:uncharacterized protein